MERVWYDQQEGRMLVGQAALDASLEQTGIGDIVPLRDLLEADDFAHTVRSFDKLDTSSWTREDLIVSGRFVLKLLQQVDGTEQPVKQKHIDRMYVLGLGPITGALYGRKNRPFTNLTDYLRAIGSTVVSAKKLYHSWTEEDFGDYSKRLEAKLGRPPTINDYDDAARTGEGPSQFIVYQRTDGVAALNERNGHVDVRFWEETDYVQWGADVIEANPDIGLTITACTILSARRQGPSDPNVKKHFGSWKAFKARAIEEADRRAVERAGKLKQYRDMAELGQLPKEYSQYDDDQLIRAAARFVLVSTCLPGRNTDDIAELLRKHRGLQSIQKIRPELSAGHIETTAVTLDIFDDIWPHPDRTKKLHITQEEYVRLSLKRYLPTKKRRIARQA